ncbi:alkaline phosphatase D family protein [Armatimonas sp.]|uniref:alkaline phosphatase D family protein n=1 Tax=Armatimonas sp. TaxID=1872638 RepID=UPI00286A2EA5|nr:alkaline phosphatase D family protein [Armatimonas sp.]
MNRRLFLATIAALPTLAQRSQGALLLPRFQENPFTLGVASGDPEATSVVLWTKLAPRPLDPDGGMPPESVEVRWELAKDESFTTILQQGKAIASRLLGHSVHVEVEGLSPDHWYWYRFHAGGATSPVGRTRTLPAPESSPESLRFAFVSCQHYETGYFTAYSPLVKEELDLVFHLGDYIYEGAGRDGQVRRHANPKLLTLTDYRTRYAQYRSDPLLQAAHAHCPWFVTWDDHEVENNYAAELSERKGADVAEFLLQRAHAYQAYYELMPLRHRSIPRGPDMQLYRKASYGTLAELLVLDTRQYRSDQPNGDTASPLNDAALSPKQTLLGTHQREWLQSALSTSPATWNVLAQQVMMGLVDRTVGPAQKFSMDQWPGYAHERMALTQFMADKKVKNPVVLTGDIHSNWVNNLRVDDRKAELPIVATEFVGTSITSGGNGSDNPTTLASLRAENPCVQFFNTQRGYVRCTVRKNQWQSDYLVVDQVTKPGGSVTTRASFVVEAGKPGARPV